ncbi:MmcB family DNA repair protein [Henriciella litoralis]|uniref:MmcB family DNA repair protein n=1 Tax=Henriciella litoralis TaxID=568102 RepID=UPI000A076479
MEPVITDDPLNPQAAHICRGVLRLFADMNLAGVTEMTLANGRRADIAAIDASGEITIVEVKSSVPDFRADAKWPDYLPYCDRFYFAVGHGFPKDLIPEHVGLIVADGFGGAVLRASGRTPLAPARRKAVTLRFARLAANRLSFGAEPIAGDLLKEA